MEDTYAAAINYVEKHGFSVIPLRPFDGTGDGKKSLGEWKYWQTHRPGLHQLEEWFAETNNGVAIICGAISGVVAVDDDVYAYEGGEPDLSSFVTPTVRTGNQHPSYHRYFLYGNHGFGRQDFSKGMKLRGDGHYVVAPPTQHPCGGYYSWTMEFDTTPAIPIPSVLSNGADPRYQGTGFNFHQYEHRATPLPMHVAKGRRTDALVSLAGTLNNRHIGWELIVELLDAYNKAACDPPVPDEKLVEIAQSVTQRYEPKGMPLFRPADPPVLTELELARQQAEERKARELAEAILQGD